MGDSESPERKRARTTRDYLRLWRAPPPQQQLATTLDEEKKDKEKDKEKEDKDKVKDKEDKDKAKDKEEMDKEMDKDKDDKNKGTAVEKDNEEVKDTDMAAGTATELDIGMDKETDKDVGMDEFKQDAGMDEVKQDAGMDIDGAGRRAELVPGGRSRDVEDAQAARRATVAAAAHVVVVDSSSDTDVDDPALMAAQPGPPAFAVDSGSDTDVDAVGDAPSTDALPTTVEAVRALPWAFRLNYIEGLSAEANRGAVRISVRAHALKARAWMCTAVC